MAKKGPRVLIGLICEVCHWRNYTSVKNKINSGSAIKLKKYCQKCRKHTIHKEIKKLD
ncbi:50S ribosomal protein L33 [Candidatus Roizmanbacteria bacterium CG22_combo_CG10-13_8_21_14_all_35_9]|uniref:Large ribosomal subunit protein bL33 n=4 Tax=Candidatus Roizmaniibacteriota TaxID=1752723 RepID=A0A2M8F4P7_9BACT|nr:MAG: 50S ribosomal protein L33 [Candidatus Roizmanbacteria bacterium CG23_combo_of_CG06-09_8_20_14_all_35_49]PIP62661.1 MAG: 50S ribosomal protein L33 [Candidatus Roizmanbacteria bacterium CG22_combo_CG10-13_8_21_14_all_35_9]PIY70841.1 MAG: 50S ribosomal protein L33 [Candidatus Roizmanbacteria bacterium CG_4_10_14_0_8_um_filter_35_28]PJC34252.1 MAG: 50S ribosomal protein L33 [Candidatus Roizmanbacteria bacterium CG_4_9_14_0_2_um_filter_35_15]PJC82604.1 MAG: 50S ribosomal protein L33 [Candida